jgi:hypothetical protein
MATFVRIPKTLAQLDASARAELTNATNHASRTDNPHSTTAAQVGADPAGTAAGLVSAHESASDPHPQYTTTAEAAAAAPVQSVAGKTGVVTLNKSDVGLSNVDNTSDLEKPISTATATALAGKANVTHTHAISDVTDLSTELSNRVLVSNYTDAQVLAKVKNVDGSGSGLDTDLIRGKRPIPLGVEWGMPVQDTAAFGPMGGNAVYVESRKEIWIPTFSAILRFSYDPSIGNIDNPTFLGTAAGGWFSLYNIIQPDPAGGGWMYLRSGRKVNFSDLSHTAVTASSTDVAGNDCLIAYRSSSNTYYIYSSSTGLTELDSALNPTGRAIATSSFSVANGVVYDPTTDRIFVCCGGDSTIRVVDPVSFTIVSSISLLTGGQQSAPASMCIDVANRLIFCVSSTPQRYLAFSVNLDTYAVTRLPGTYSSPTNWNIAGKMANGWFGMMPNTGGNAPLLLYKVTGIGQMTAVGPIYSNGRVIAPVLGLDNIVISCSLFTHESYFQLGRILTY